MCFIILKINQIFFKSISVLDGVVIYPRESQCSRVGGMCVEKNKCKSLVSASGLCPLSQSKGVECCFECKLIISLKCPKVLFKMFLLIKFQWNPNTKYVIIGFEAEQIFSTAAAQSIYLFISYKQQSSLEAVDLSSTKNY